MGIKERAKEVIDKADDFIAEKGLGHAQLDKAKAAQRNINIAAVASVVLVAGVLTWLVTKK